MTSRNFNKLGGYMGSFIGSMGWLLGFIAVAVNIGAQDFLKEIVPIGLLVSLSFFLVLVLLCEFIYEKNLKENMALYSTTLFGFLFFFAGTLIHIINYWIAPKIEYYPDVKNALRNMGSVYKISDIFTLILLVGGCVLLIVALILLKKQTKTVVHS